LLIKLLEIKMIINVSVLWNTLFMLFFFEPKNIKFVEHDHSPLQEGWIESNKLFV